MNVYPLLAVRISAGYRSGVEVLRDFQLEVFPREIVGLVGQSGSGKSTVSLSILQLLWMKGAHCRGRVIYQGSDLLRMNDARMREIRGKEISLVLQSPVSALNPAMRIGAQFREARRAHAAPLPPRQEDERFLKLFETVNLEPDPRFLQCYPGEVSVGQAQRLLIAMAILHKPRLLIADEPTSALDPITQAEILDLFAQLRRKLGMAILYISHDLLSVASLCDRIAILQNGCIVESGETRRLFSTPRHPYTRRLLATLPDFGSPHMAS